MTDDAKKGALTIDDLLDLWASSVDRSYSAPIIAAGEGNGLEAFTQGFAQFSRVSQAIDITMQAMFIRPWSGQTNPPAGGERKATVTLTAGRTTRSTVPIILGANVIFFEEEQVDWGIDEGEVVLTGRRYTPSVDFYIEPGAEGPFDVPCIAERPGWGYNNPRPNTIKVIDQPGNGFSNTGASIVAFTAPLVGVNPTPPFSSVTVTAANTPDMFVPEHVGQYVLFTAGSNVGFVARMASFIAPNASLNQGSGVTLDLLASVEFFNLIDFTIGETLELRDAGLTVQGYGQLLSFEHTTSGSGTTKIIFRMLNGVLPPDSRIVGQQSSGFGFTAVVLTENVFVNETGTAAWRVLGWDADLGLTITNPLQPQGGQLGILDELGAERNIFRAPGEGDESYRDRVATIADVVTPNAIRRTLNKALGPVPWCLRETGLTPFPGFYLDHDALDYTMTRITGAVTGTFLDGEAITQTVSGVIASGVARTRRATATPPLPAPPGAETLQGFVRTGKTDFVTGAPIVGAKSGATVTPATITQSPRSVDRFKLIMGYLEFRAYMFIGIRPSGAGEFGFAYDVGSFGAFDASPYDDFFDGFPMNAAQVRVRASQAIDKVRAGGVGFEFYEETGPCP